MWGCLISSIRAYLRVVLVVSVPATNRFKTVAIKLFLWNSVSRLSFSCCTTQRKSRTEIIVYSSSVLQCTVNLCCRLQFFNSLFTHIYTFIFIYSSSTVCSCSRIYYHPFSHLYHSTCRISFSVCLYSSTQWWIL